MMAKHGKPQISIGTSRRRFMQMAAAAVASAAAARSAGAASGMRRQPYPDTYEFHAREIRIVPGAWRPHYGWEHIAWVSPSWPSQDYVWLDFPEAVFSSQGLLFLSHVNPKFPAAFNDLPKVPWQVVENGISFERALPSGISFGGSVLKLDEPSVALELHIHNGSQTALNDITLQTCAFLRAIKEFGDHTNDNKLVHTAAEGWAPLSRALELPDSGAPYRAGWRRSGRSVLDAPVAVALSNQAERLLAFTWGGHTLSMVGNANHPCVHADPFFPNLEPGQKASIAGKLTFFDGKLDDFDYKKLVKSIG